MLKKIKKCLSDLNNIVNLTQISKEELPDRGVIGALEGEILVKGKKAILQIGWDDYFPLHKPMYFLKPYNNFGFLPHIEKDGYICYISDEGLIINQENISNIINESFTRVIETLEMGITGKNKIDFLNEFEAYWQNNINCNSSIKSMISLDSYIKQVQIASIKKYKFLIAGDQKSELINYIRKLLGGVQEEEIKFLKSLYIPLRKGTKIYPPPYNDFWSIKQIRRKIFNNLSSSNKNRLETIVKNSRVNSNSLVNIIVNIPQPNGNNALLGIYYKDFIPKKSDRNSYNKNYAHPLYKTDARCKINPVVIERHNKKHIVPRGGGNNNINSKNVALIGCGSVGSQIAFQLAKTGISNMFLIDKEKLAIENIYRHSLGIDKLYNPEYKSNPDNFTKKLKLSKVLGLKNELEQKLPYLNIDYSTESIEEIVDRSKIDFKKFDLIMVALGNPTLELFLNHYFHENYEELPIIYTWLEPYGIGGHALLTNNNKKSGCLKCLYNSNLYNRASFSKEGQFFAKSISGCGSLYTEYSNLDSVQTAIIASRLAINTLTGKEKNNPILSWKGNKERFLEEGFQLSERYFLREEKLRELRYKYINDDCEVCRNNGN